MPRILAKKLGELQRFFLVRDSLLDNLFSKAAGKGTRIGPEGSKHDESFGIRLDNGAVFEKDGKTMKRIELQINKEAKDPGLKALLQENGSHYVYATADVEIPDGEFTQDQRKDRTGNVFGQLEKALEEA